MGARTFVLDNLTGKEASSVNIIRYEVLRQSLMRVLFAVAGLSAASNTSASQGLRWVAYYGADAPGISNELQKYDIIVLDSDRHPSLEPLLRRGRSVLGYLSVGEVNRFRPYFEEVRKEGILLEANTHWPDSYGVDVRDERWSARVLEQLVPSILSQGFTGVFLDTIDSAVALENDPVRSKSGFKLAMRQLIRRLRQNYPDITIAVNRGYALWPEISPWVNIVVGESVLSTYDFSKKVYYLREQNEALWQIEGILAAKRLNPALLTLTLDYWEAEDAAGINQIYERHRTTGLVPYVSTIALDRVIAEPGRP